MYLTSDILNLSNNTEKIYKFSVTYEYNSNILLSNTFENTHYTYLNL